MNKYIKLATLATTTAVMGMSTFSLAEEAPAQQERIVISGSGSITLDQDGNVDVKALAHAAFNLSESAQIQLAVDLAEAAEGLVDGDFDWESYIKEALISFDVDSLGRVTAAIKMDLDRINMSVLDPEGSLEGDGIKGVAAIRVHMRTAYLDGLTLTVSETEDNGISIDTSSVRISAEAAKALGMVKVDAGLAYVFNDVSEDTYKATAAVSLDLSEVIASGVEAFVSGSIDDEGSIDYTIGGNYVLDDGLSFGLMYENYADEELVSVGVNKIFNNGNTLSGTVGVDTNTGAKKIGIKLDIPISKLWSR